MTAAGVTQDDVVQIAFGYGMFTGAFGLHYGAESIGASVIPMSGGNTEKQIMIMQDYRPRFWSVRRVMPSPSPIGWNGWASIPKSLSLQARAFRWRTVARGDAPGDRDPARASVPLTTTASRRSSGRESRGSALHKCGMHIFEDHFIPEIIDPDTGEVLPPGQRGELVLTTLTKEAFPMIRYRTRDITSLDYAPCACGRPIVRMKKTMGRSDDMLIIKGVNVFPSQIEEVLFQIEGCEPHYQLVVEREGAHGYP